MQLTFNNTRESTGICAAMNCVITKQNKRIAPRVDAFNKESTGTTTIRGTVNSTSDYTL
jgi:hypothetical protein